ncbi:MAG: oxidoreductase, partial [Bacteroidales bacterium]
MKKKIEKSRRRFITTSAVAAIGALGAGRILTSCSESGSSEKIKALPPMPEKAPDGRPLKAGLIGCGGRGTGAAINFLDAGNGLEIAALGDVFQDRLDNCRAELKKQRNVEVPDEKCFVGFDAYEKVIDSGVDIVLLCTPPHFRPAHVE